VAHNGADGLANDLVPTEVGRAVRSQVGNVGRLYAGKSFEIIPALAGQLFAPEVAHLEAMLGRNVFQLTLE
jgi:hypothetical protein